VTALRYEQYARALCDDRAFHRRYMVPVELPARRGERQVVDADMGVHATSRAALGELKRVTPGGVVTFGTQTHPADGAAGLIVTSEERARSLGAEGVARILAFGTTRVEKGRVPKAPVPAARVALADAGIDFGALDAVATHNPFAVNDIYFSRQSGVPVEKMNVYGSSLVYGHPQAPTGAASDRRADRDAARARRRHRPVHRLRGRRHGGGRRGAGRGPFTVRGPAPSASRETGLPSSGA
jgi:acetyl-CoA C-acetyltransferase